jgi:hypothetical protein
LGGFSTNYRFLSTKQPRGKALTLAAGLSYVCRQAFLARLLKPDIRQPQFTAPWEHAKAENRDTDSVTDRDCAGQSNISCVRAELDYAAMPRRLRAITPTPTSPLSISHADAGSGTAVALYVKLSMTALEPIFTTTVSTSPE